MDDSVLLRQPNILWLTQRLSAVVITLICPFLIYKILNLKSFDYESICRWIAAPWTTAVLALTLVSLIYHSYLGLKVIIEDYIFHYERRHQILKTLQLIAFVLIGFSLYFLMKIARIY